MARMASLNNSAAWSPVRYSVTRLGGGTSQNGVSYPGGLDQTTPSLSLQSGALRAIQNFECALSGGYARIAGYERYDGRAKPSDASFTIVQFSAFTHTPAVNDTLTQAVSGATGTVIAVSTTPGSIYVALTQVSGTFDTTHSVTDGGPTVGTPITTTIALSSLLTAQYTALAADVYRTLIGAVPGSGPVRGVVHFASGGVDTVYAFRNNAGATAVAIYKNSGSGWTLVPFYRLVNFTAGGVAAAKDGDTLTQGGVTATVKRVMWRSGAWSGTAAGGFVITTPAGGSFAAGAATLAPSGATVTLSGADTAITLSTGGRFEFTKGNFSGSITTRRMYGCDGVNQAFEFDGDILAPITTGNVPDAPKHIVFHKNYLFVTQNATLTYCGVGTPFKWSVTDGGGQIATGDTVTGVITLPGSQSTATLLVTMKSNTAFLYGLSTSDFNYVQFNNGSGALDYSLQNLFDTLVFDTLGVITLKTTLNWGNFLPSTLTHNILPYILAERGKITASCILRSKGQYRVFFNDGLGLWLTIINQSYLGAATVLFPNPVNVVDYDIDSDGNEVTYFGSTDSNGYIYQMEKGTSFDGAAITAFITPAWDALNSPRILKRWRAASVEVQSSNYAAFSYGYQLGYGVSTISQPAAVNVTSSFQAAPAWDTFVWDNFTWDGQTLSPSDVDMTGTAENVQVTITSGTNYIAPYTVNSLIYHYSNRRGIRV